MKRNKQIFISRSLSSEVEDVCSTLQDIAPAGVEVRYFHTNSINGVISAYNPGSVKFTLQFSGVSFGTLAIWVRYADKRHDENLYYPYGYTLAMWDFDLE